MVRAGSDCGRDHRLRQLISLLVTTMGVLDGGGGSMSPVDFKKHQCHMFLSLIFPYIIHC